MTIRHDGGGRNALALFLCLAILLQFSLLAYNFPLSELWSGSYNAYVDHPYHVYQLEAGRSYLRDGRLTGFDPWFGGGYLGGVTYNVSARLPVLIGSVLPASVPAGAVYSTYLFLLALFSPFAVTVMARQLAWPPAHTLFATLVALVFWWTGALRWYYSAGMASFASCAFLALPYAVWVWRLLRREDCGKLPLFAAGAVGGLGMWFHPFFVLLSGSLVACLALRQWRDIEVACCLRRGGLILAIAVGLNLPWLIAMVGVDNIAMQSPYQRKVGAGVALSPLLGSWDHGAMGTPFYPLVAALCAAGYLLGTVATRRSMQPFLLACLGLLLFAAYGAVVPSIADLQPNRFIAAAYLYLGVAAAYVMGQGWDWMRAQPSRGPAIACALVALPASAFFGREVVREARPGDHGHYGNNTREIAPVQGVTRQLADWLRANTTAQGRVLFETSLGRVHDRGHAAAALALLSGREFVGAPYPHSLPAVSFWDEVAFGKPIGELTVERMQLGLDTYNVGWVLAHSDRLQQFMARFPGATLAERIGRVNIYQLDRRLSYIQAGEGRVSQRGFNRLQVEGVRGGAVTLRYNWVPGLVATPAAQVVAVAAPGGFPAQIGVRNAPPAFTLSVCTALCATAP